MLKTIVITAGGTSEEIDKVRTITNMSTGKLGATICNKILNEIPEEINKVYYICSTSSIKPIDNEKIKLIIVKGAYDLKEKIETLLNTVKVDFFIHSMAVSDYTTDYVSSSNMLVEELTEKLINLDDGFVKENIEKIIEQTLTNPNNSISRNKKMSSKEDDIFIKLKKTPKVISVIKKIQPDLVLIGFKLLNDVSKEELTNAATGLLIKNDCNYVIANDLADIKRGNHKAIIFDKNSTNVEVNSKNEIADKITDIIQNK